MSRECPVARWARETPGARALEHGPDAWSYGELELEVRWWCGWLEERGLRAGDRVAVVCRNRPEVVALLHAVGRQGAALVPCNVRLAARELDAQLARVAPRVTLDDAALDEVGRARRATPTAVGAPPGPVAATVDEAAVLAALFTSGATGVPKLVELRQAHFLASAAASAANLGGAPSQRWLCVLPLFHVGGLAMAHRCAVYGAALVLEPRFEPRHLASVLASGAVTHASLVATMLSRVLEVASAPFPAVTVLVGGGPVAPSLLARARAAGLTVLQTYGLTEACSQVATERPDAADGRTAGAPLPGTEVRVVDDAGRPVPPGVAGLLEVRGPTVAVGDGWLETGDLGTLDPAGRLTVLARRDDLIVSGGENVSPLEVEAVLAEHPAISDVAVVAADDALWGQVPVALVVERLPVESASLAAFARERLAGFKVPRRWVRVPALPRTPLGKLARPQARALAQSAGAPDVPSA